jgi:hypothetical protein
MAVWCNGKSADWPRACLQQLSHTTALRRGAAGADMPGRVWEGRSGEGWRRWRVILGKGVGGQIYGGWGECARIDGCEGHY